MHGATVRFIVLRGGKMAASWENEENGSGALKVITFIVGWNADCFETVMKSLTRRVLFSENCPVGAGLKLKLRRYGAQPNESQLVRGDGEAQYY